MVLRWIPLMASKRSFSSLIRTNFGFEDPTRRSLDEKVLLLDSEVSRRWDPERSTSLGSKVMERAFGPKGSDIIGRLPRMIALFKDFWRSASSNELVTDLSIVRTLRRSTCDLTTLSLLNSFANWRMLLTIKPRITIPPTEYGNTSPLPRSLTGWRSPKPTVSIVTSQKYNASTNVQPDTLAKTPPPPASQMKNIIVCRIKFLCSSESSKCWG